jgi:hypothetical protein
MKTEFSDDEIKALLQDAGFHNHSSPYLACGSLEAFRRLIALIQSSVERRE